ncbi:DUF3349 domain-containing protein [Ornithinimicrobium cerasi]|uniref:DUF3349 domain-containing protein n=1 Tax=Ornithinimicrobium cerasi TaxID=2248773 RepID=A0A285VSL6_9MICO|nr:DUF3349 domain-containing protein [Ornithinimicrobium cerasi]SOC57045.1 Protein of unknown function [Ornithinimicrobium cerasi]
MSVAEPERRPGVISRVVSWLRAGYPGGVPTGDYVALLGVLRRRLSEAEIQAIAEELAAQRDLGLTSERVRELIREHSLLDPHEEDVARVSEVLASTGYPVEDEDEDEDEAEGEPDEAGRGLSPDP